MFKITEFFLMGITRKLQNSLLNTEDIQQMIFAAGEKWGRN